MEQIESAYEGVSQRLLVQIDEQELELCLRVFRKVELTLRGPGTAMESGPDDGLSGEVGA